MGVLNLSDWLPRVPKALGNRERGRIVAEAQGRAWTLRLNMNHLVSMCERFELEEEGIAPTLMKLATKIDTPPGLRIAMWFALLEHQPEVTLEQAGQVVTDIGFERSGDLVLETLRWAMPEPEKGVAERGKAGAASTGGAITS